MTIRTCVESVKSKRIFSVVVVAALALVLGIALSPQKDDIPETQRTVLGINISHATNAAETEQLNSSLSGSPVWVALSAWIRVSTWYFADTFAAPVPVREKDYCTDE